MGEVLCSTENSPFLIIDHIHAKINRVCCATLAIGKRCMNVRKNKLFSHTESSKTQFISPFLCKQDLRQLQPLNMFSHALPLSTAFGLNIFITHQKQHMNIHDMQSIDRIRTEALKHLSTAFALQRGNNIDKTGHIRSATPPPPFI